MKVTIDLPITDQELLDVITGAIEGNGIQYWACEEGPISIWRDKDLNITKAKFEVEGETKTITPAVIERGIKNLIENSHSNAAAAEIVKELLQEDKDLDAWDNDVIIQYGLFGEVVYG